MFLTAAAIPSFASSFHVGHSLAPAAAIQATTPVDDDDWDCSDRVVGSPYIPVDSWIYPAVLRLYSLGYVDSAYLNLRPWTRASLSNMLEETEERLEDADKEPGEDEAEGIYESLKRELSTDDDPCKLSKHVTVHEDSAYTLVRGISGTPLRDSYHLGSTIVNDYGRPYAGGFNNYTGTSGYASSGRFALYLRAEFQGAPSATGYSAALANQLAARDLTTNYFSQSCWYSNSGCVALPTKYLATIPQGAIQAATRPRFLEAYVSAQVLNHVFSFGKQDFWQSPAQGGAMSYSNNAENVYAFRINRIEPLTIPLISQILGPIRYDFMVGPLKGHTYPRDPWVHAEKISIKPTPNVEFGFERTVIWGGKGHEPITAKSFLRSFFSVSNQTAATKAGAQDPGARFGAFDFTYRLPFVRNWLTVYCDSEVHDDVSPADAPRRASWRPGIYLTRVPGLPKLDVRAEAASTDPPVSSSNSGVFMYWEAIQREGYTNSGQLFGDWIGREGKGGQAWITYHLSGNEFIQASYRNQKVAKDFVAGGTTLNDFTVQAVKRIRKDLEIKGDFTVEHYKAPTYLPGQQTVTSTQVQITWYPGRKVSF